jgi:hypothetical protein
MDKRVDLQNHNPEVRQAAMEIRKPIIIIGAGRSGTTILYNLLALHPEVCWVSNLTNRYPRLPQLAVLHRVLDVPFIGHSMKQRLPDRTKSSLRPSEAENVYRAYCGFEDGRKMTADDLTPEMEDRFKGLVSTHLELTGKPRFLNKRTANTQRIELIDRMFPDAYYVHLIRDGRAAAASLFSVRWWPEIDIWWLGSKAGEWEKTGREPIELCALHWQRNVQELLAHRGLFEDRYLELRYEELVEDTPGSVSKIVRFCELLESQEFMQYIPEKLVDMNYKWKEQLNEKQKMVMNEAIGPFLVELGYAI